MYLSVFKTSSTLILRANKCQHLPISDINCRAILMVCSDCCFPSNHLENVETVQVMSYNKTQQIYYL